MDTNHTIFISPEIPPTYLGYVQPTNVLQPPPVDEIQMGLNFLEKPPQSQCCGVRKQNNTWSSDPQEWGPHLWYYLHTCAANYPKNPSREQRRGMKNWLQNLKWTIPCKMCSDHYGSYIFKNQNRLDEICQNRENLFAFFVDIHNKVNRRNNKPEMSLEDAKKLYNIL